MESLKAQVISTRHLISIRLTGEASMFQLHPCFTRFFWQPLLFSSRRGITCWALGLVVLIAGCAPLYQATMSRYTRTCINAEESGQFDVAIEACRRAWINTQVGRLGKEDESITLYNLGRVLRLGGRLGDAETALRDSLILEEELSGPSSLMTGKRLGELSAVLGLLKRTAEGLRFLERFQAIAPQFVGKDRQFAALLFYAYAESLQNSGDSDRATRLEQAASDLGFKKSDFGE